MENKQTIQKITKIKSKQFNIIGCIYNSIKVTKVLTI